MDLKQAAISIAMIVFVLSSMLGMGLGLRVSEIVAPLRNWRLVLLSLVANFVVMPFAALALARMLRLEESMGIGLLLLGMAGGAPFLPKLAQIARGNLAFAVGLMVLLIVVTVGYLPLVLPLLLPGVSVSPAQIARSLVLLMLLPLGSALALRANSPNIAAKIKPIFDRTSNLSLIALMALQTLLNIRRVIAVFGTGGILAGVVFLGVGVAVGWAPWRLKAGHTIRPGAGNGATEHRRRTRRRQPELRGPKRGGHGRRRRDRRAADPHAAVPRTWAARAGNASANRLRQRPRGARTTARSERRRESTRKCAVVNERCGRDLSPHRAPKVPSSARCSCSCGTDSQDPTRP